MRIEFLPITLNGKEKQCKIKENLLKFLCHLEQPHKSSNLLVRGKRFIVFLGQFITSGLIHLLHPQEQKSMGKLDLNINDGTFPRLLIKT